MDMPHGQLQPGSHYYVINALLRDLHRERERRAHHSP
jgi:hypothetical protein